MSIVDFNYLKVTTMTVIVKLKGKTLIENIFPLLDITRIELPTQIRSSKKFKLPYCGVPGAILSAKYRNITRGIIKSSSDKSFLNCITIDICTSKKNINCKLSGEMIQMTGPNSEGLARETAEHLIDHLINLQTELDYIGNIDQEDKMFSIEWLKENTIGKIHVIDSETQEIIEIDETDVLKDMGADIGMDTDTEISFTDLETIQDYYGKTYRILTSDGKIKEREEKETFDSWHEGDEFKVIEGKTYLYDADGNQYNIISPIGEIVPAIIKETFFINTTIVNKNTVYNFTGVDGKPIQIIRRKPIEAMIVNSITIPDTYPDKYPDGIDERVVNFYLKYAPDFVYHHVYCQFLESIVDITEIISPDLGIDSLNMAMINYSYSLGMSINRWELVNRIRGRNGFTARFDNSADHCVTISLPYENNNNSYEEQTTKTSRKKKEKCHTFMVYKSGIVTQSGPDIEAMREAYYLFMETIKDIKPFIMKKNTPFKLKYKPIPYKSKDMLIKCK
jgi:hypothetical protein